MRQFLLTASLVFSLGLAACADHAGSIAAVDNVPQPPIGPTDGNTVGSNPGGGTPALPGGGDGGFTPGGGGGGTPPTDGGGTGGTGGAGSGGGGGGKGGGKGGGGQGGGDAGGSPVPEPGTMLLVGTGLAGAALMRRRRQPQIEQA